MTTADLFATLEDSLASSVKLWIAAGASVEKNCDAIAASAHTLFIARCQRGLYEEAGEKVPF